MLLLAPCGRSAAIIIICNAQISNCVTIIKCAIKISNLITYQIGQVKYTLIITKKRYVYEINVEINEILD